MLGELLNRLAQLTVNGGIQVRHAQQGGEERVKDIDALAR